MVGQVEFKYKLELDSQFGSNSRRGIIGGDRGNRMRRRRRSGGGRGKRKRYKGEVEGGRRQVERKMEMIWLVGRR